MAVSQAKIIEALLKYGGNVTKSAKACKITREHLTARIKENPKLQGARDGAREELLDIAEENIFDVVRKEKGKKACPNSKWLLQTLGKNRGFTERTEVTGEGGGPIEVTLKRKVVK